jgi:regulatory protein
MCEYRKGTPRGGGGEAAVSGGGAEAGAAKGRRRRQPLKATPAGLERSAIYYLERYDSCSGHLRRLLRRKIEVSARVHGTDPEEGRAAVEALIGRLTGAGLLDDARYARERVRSLLARGSSDAMIRARLRARSLPAELIDMALAEATAGSPDHALRAALRYARRRRLGPFRLRERAERRDRDLAALGRQGFDYETARRVVDCDDPAALEAEIDAG